MTIRFASLGSGSKGNGTLIESGDTCLLVDCGFSVRETEKRLARLGRTGQDLSAILVTHEHSDHGRGAAALARKYGLSVYLTAGTLRGLHRDAPAVPKIICGEQEFEVGAISVTPVTVPHDAREPVQFHFTAAGRRVGVLTDLGCITPHVVNSFNGCDGLLLEANHDTAMLDKGPYPAALKRRVGGDWGHLNNDQAVQFLRAVERHCLQILVLGHISLQNNAVSLVKNAVAPLQQDLHQVHYACQEQGFDWHGID